MRRNQFLASLLSLLALGCGKQETRAKSKDTPDVTVEGGEVGNGGGGVVCRHRDGSIQSVELIDYYVARSEWNITVDLGGGTYIEMVQRVLTRLKRLDERSVAYSKKLDDFLQNTVWLTGSTLPTPTDTAEIAVPNGNCQFETIALQRKPMFPREKLYRINKDIWDKMDEVNRAGLVLHEIIYAEALELGQENSRKTRYFNANLSSNYFETMHHEEYFELLKSVGFSPGSVNVLGFIIKHENSSFYQTGSLQSGFLAEDSKWMSPQFNAPIELKGKTRIELYENGSLKVGVVYKNVVKNGECNFYFESDQQIFLSETGILESVIISEYNNFFRFSRGLDCKMSLLSSLNGDRRFEFYDSGIVKTGFLYSKTYTEYNTVSFPVFQKYVRFGGEIAFHQNGLVKRGRIKWQEKLWTNQDRFKQYDENVRLDFDEQGRVIEH